MAFAPAQNRGHKDAVAELQMTWEQKLATMQGLQNRFDLLMMLNPGEWICNLPAELGGDGFLSPDLGAGPSPEAAVNDAWERVTALAPDRYLVVETRGDNGTERRHYRWNGFMFATERRAG
jgi:hypothetical protein